MKRMWKKPISQLLQNHASLIIKTSTVTACTLVLFTQDLTIMFNDALHSEATSYILLVPLMFLYMIYRKRKMLRTVVSFQTTNSPKESKYLQTVTGILLSTIAFPIVEYARSRLRSAMLFTTVWS